MKVYLVDYIGMHCGMHYYNDAFCRVLSAVPGLDVSVLSNYAGENDSRPFFLHQYKGNRLRKICCLLRNYLMLFCFVLRNKKACFVYLAYGNSIDLPFMYIVSLAKKSIIDIHEAIAQNADDNAGLKRCFRKVYSERFATVIVHSQRTNDLLEEYGYRGNRLFVPHFKYCFSKNYDIRRLGPDIVSAIAEDKVNILFFGNITYDKGIDILISAVNSLEPELRCKANVIIAGKDFDGTVHRVQPSDKAAFNIVLRHIEDDELVYLYEHTDYVALPYRKTSQSGILEMAFYFRKPILASDVPYFRRMLTEFPSFGILSGKDVPAYAETLASVIGLHSSADYFTDEDYFRYTNRSEIEAFKKQFAIWIKR